MSTFSKIQTRDKGFVMKIVLIVIAIIALKYTLDFDIIDWVTSENGQKIIQPVWNVIKSFYNWVDGLFRGATN
jgi:uncharacterized YccA/Bax inhibitor family protein